MRIVAQLLHIFCIVVYFNGDGIHNLGTAQSIKHVIKMILTFNERRSQFMWDLAETENPIVYGVL